MAVNGWKKTDHRNAITEFELFGSTIALRKNFLLALNSWIPLWWGPHSFYLRSEGADYRKPVIGKNMCWCLHHHRGYRVAMEPRAHMRHLWFGSSAGINEKKRVNLNVGCKQNISPKKQWPQSSCLKWCYQSCGIAPFTQHRFQSCSGRLSERYGDGGHVSKHQSCMRQWVRWLL